MPAKYFGWKNYMWVVDFTDIFATKTLQMAVGYIDLWEPLLICCVKYFIKISKIFCLFLFEIFLYNYFKFRIAIIECFTGQKFSKPLCIGVI